MMQLNVYAAFYISNLSNVCIFCLILFNELFSKSLILINKVTRF